MYIYIYKNQCPKHPVLIQLNFKASLGGLQPITQSYWVAATLKEYIDISLGFNLKPFLAFLRLSSFLTRQLSSIQNTVFMFSQSVV